MSEQIPSEEIEAEVVQCYQREERHLAVRPESNLPTVADLEQQFALAVRQRELLSEYIKKQLVPGKHFYELQGNKPSLTKEGAEIILLPHNLAPDYEIVAGPDAPPEDGKAYQITVKCTLRRKGDPQSFVGSGIGSAGSMKRDKHGNYNPRQTDKYLCHNATLKMAEKSAMISATLNSTAGSEFFTQDIDPGETPQEAPRAPVTSRPPSRATQAPKAPEKPVPAPPREATEATKAWMIENLKPCRDDAIRFFIDLGVILPTEGLEDVPLAKVPTSRSAMIKLVADITKYAIDGKIDQPVVPQKNVPQPEIPNKGTPDRANERGDWFWDLIVPIPRKGMKREGYLKNPDTIRSLYEARHGNDEEAAEARRRLFGFVNSYEPKTWVDRTGQTRMPGESDLKFRRALDAFADWFAKNHPDENL